MSHRKPSQCKATIFDDKDGGYFYCLLQQGHFGAHETVTGEMFDKLRRPRKAGAGQCDASARSYRGDGKARLERCRSLRDGCRAA